MPKVAALIVAAGRGHRFGGEIPKQYCALYGEPVLRHTLSKFVAHPDVNAIVTVIHPDDRALYDEAAAGLGVIEPVSGGVSRRESVYNGLEALVNIQPDAVLIHDAARPFFTDALISEIVAALDLHVGAAPGIPVADTLKRVRDGFVETTVDRSGLWRVQTPQGFRYPEILAAHKAAAGMNLTDDAAIAEKAGFDVVMLEGVEGNTKITRAEDLDMIGLARAAQWEYRTGQGFDVHRFEPGDKVQLCGVSIDHDKALAGHSDADVGLHALTDAILGAAAAGDIGEHFPPTDPQWRGANSSIFLRYAAKLITDMDAKIVNVDVTLICEAPKVAPHRAKMRALLADLLNLEVDRVGIKATTTEKLGFTGRCEGIAAQALATIRVRAEE